MTTANWRKALNLRIAAAGFSSWGVSTTAGLSTSTVHDILSGRSRRPRYRTLYLIGTVLGCTVEELLNPPADLDKIVLQQASVCSAATAPAETHVEIRSNVAIECQVERNSLSSIPILDLEALEDDVGSDRSVRGELALPQLLIDPLMISSPAILIVRDDAMAPTLKRGELLLIDRAITRARQDGIYVLYRPGRVTIRRIQIDPISENLTILAENANYTPITDVSPDAFRIIGLVVWQGRAL